MKRKQNKKVSTIRKHWVGLLLVFTPVILLLVGAAVIYFVNEKSNAERDHRDDIKFAKMETFIEITKNYLSAQSPEAKWTTSHACEEPNIKSGIHDWDCTYEVKNASQVLNSNAVKEALSNLSSVGSVKEYSFDKGVGYDFDLKGLERCYANMINETDANISCAIYSRYQRYSLQN